MPTYTMHAIVLSKTKLKDSDLIITLLASDGSQVRAVAKGIRKPRSRLRGTVEVFSEVSLLCAKGRNLDIITEAKLIDAHEKCREEYERICAAETVCELLKRVSLEDHPQRNLFEMTVTSIHELGTCNTGSLKLMVASTMLKVASLLGYRPILDRCAVCGGKLDASKDKVAFSMESGGCLCRSCKNSGNIGGEPRELLAWISALISSTFSEIATYRPSPDIVLDIVTFASRWLEVHASTHLKSLQYLMNE